GQALDRRSLAAELTDRPADRARAQQAPRSADLRVLLHERDHLAEALVADPAALAPPDPHWTARPGRIDYLDHHSAVTRGDDSATRASGHWIAGLDLEHQARTALHHRGQMEAGEIEEKIATVAAAERVRAGARRVGHCRGP